MSDQTDTKVSTTSEQESEAYKELRKEMKRIEDLMTGGDSTKDLEPIEDIIWRNNVKYYAYVTGGCIALALTAGFLLYGLIRGLTS